MGRAQGMHERREMQALSSVGKPMERNTPGENGIDRILNGS